MQNGVLLMDKETDCTSHDVVQTVRRTVGQRKVGHCGTLDPGATGLLVLTLGKATRLTRFLIQAPKVYEGVIRFGVTTDTYDRWGTVISEASTEGLAHEAVAAAMTELAGTYEQTAPPYSAKKIKGVKYYELARRGEEVPETTKEVTVFDFTAVAPLEGDRLRFSLSCTSGTYVRTVAHDLGKILGCGAHLDELRRAKVGPFEVADAMTVGELRERVDEGRDLTPSWIDFDAVPLPFGAAEADTQQEDRIMHGQSVLFRQLDGEEGDWIKLINRRRRLIAVGTITERIGRGRVGVVQPRIVFN